MNAAIIEHGGIVFSLKAHIVCAGCTECADYFADPDEVTLDQFERDAQRHFEASGWKVGLFVPRTLCPTCR